MNSREKQREKRRKEILLCGLNSITERGYEATTIRDIAKELHISVGLFFNYFESKDQLYEELVRIGMQGPEAAVKLIGTGMDPIVLFEKITEYIVGALRENNNVAKIFILMAQSMRSVNLPENVKKLFENFDTVTPFVPVVREGQRLGRIKPGDPSKLVAMYWVAVQGLAENFAFTDWPPEVVDWIVDILRA